MIDSSLLNAAVSRTLQAARRASGLTWVEIAGRSGLALRSAMRYFEGQRHISAVDLHAAAAVFGLSGAEMLRRAEQEATVGGITSA